ncbi:hypothetical protein PHYBOEH_005522 [Phytophthora boehmeriae]|uniref:Pentatricopeptide repeat-containing protein n=1 Tax=Phytophthora boehmeriae TaxID=109152 RepID=A0A8T1X595_9STRA|nr:hypothetical protein PHYBOEH_005522 [Phytophthora boehmeriae]
MRRVLLRAASTAPTAQLRHGSSSSSVAIEANCPLSSRRQSPSSSFSRRSPPTTNSFTRAPPKLRVQDRDVAVLLAARSPPDLVARACRTLRQKDEISLLAATDPRVWNVALQRRLEWRDERGAAEVLGLVASFAPENASEPVWTDLLFTMVRRRSGAAETQQLLDKLQKRYGAQFVARILVSVVNGCANLNMYGAAKDLLLYQQQLWTQVRAEDETIGDRGPIMPPSVIGHLLGKMATKKMFDEAIQLATEYFEHESFIAARDFQQQGFLALFQACQETGHSPKRIVRTFIEYVDGSAKYCDGNLDDFRELVLERGFGAAIQSCVALEEFSLALHCYSTMNRVREQLICADENIYVNVMKACSAVTDFGLLKDAFRSMVARGVARSAGFGSAIRYCHENLDADFLEEVLNEVFATEQNLKGAWMLELANYNDALGCFADTKRFDQAKELFSQMVNNPFILPDHITMLEMVENHRDASIEDIFNLMDVFLEWKLAPNLQVFTSLLSVCMRRRIVGDAVALIKAMKQRGVVLDVKAFTTIAFIHASQGDLKAVVCVLHEMARNDIATDQVFFDYVTNGIYGSCGIDMCFSLFRELTQSNLAIPEGLYVSLVELGTKIGLIERTLHIAYNMECEGFCISSEQLHDLMLRCKSDSEISEFMRTFSLLHQGKQPDTPRFEVELYEELMSILMRFNRKNDASIVHKLAHAAGHDDVIV